MIRFAFKKECIGCCVKSKLKGDRSQGTRQEVVTILQIITSFHSTLIEAFGSSFMALTFLP